MAKTVKGAKAKKEKKSKKVAKKEAPKRTAEQLMEDATAFVSAQKKTVPVYKRIKEILEVTPNGRPSRVVVKCSDPQVNGTNQSVCDETREIAIQDLHQVTRCVPCQKRSVQLYRNTLAKSRRTELASRRKTSKKPSKKTSNKK